jgi:hypothetical protein
MRYIGRKANRPRSERDFVEDTLRHLDLAVERAQRDATRLRQAAADARRASERARRLIDRAPLPSKGPEGAIAAEGDSAADREAAEWPPLRSVR